jgi:polyhydroxybutyrate depolymerase
VRFHHAQRRQRGEGFADRGRLEQRFGRDGRAVHGGDAIALGPRDLAVSDDRDTDAGHVQALHLIKQGMGGHRLASDRHRGPQALFDVRDCVVAIRKRRRGCAGKQRRRQRGHAHDGLAASLRNSHRDSLEWLISNYPLSLEHAFPARKKLFAFEPREIQMHSYHKLKAVVKAAFCGASDSTGPCLSAVPATLARPEGRRRYLIAAPGKKTSGKPALVVVLHGNGASAEQVMGMAFPPSPLSLLLEIAERERFVVIAPDAGKGGWSDCFASAAQVAKKDDVEFISALIDTAIASHDVDPDRVHVIGVSRGGWMAYRLAIEIPHKLAAFSAVLAALPERGRVRMPEAPLPALIFGGTADPLIPYHGGKYFYAFGFMDPAMSIEETVKVWRELAKLDDAPDISRIDKRDDRDRTSVTRTMWGTDPNGLQVGLYRIEHGGHAEPSRLKRYPYFINKLVGRQNADVEVAEAAWEFFKSKRAKPVRSTAGSVNSLLQNEAGRSGG